MGRVEGKVALITGGARGQGRNHALKLAEQGADIIVLDMCENLATIPYGLASQDDFDETAASVEKLGRRVVAAKVDIREADQLTDVVAKAVSDLGGLDIVCANAGICSFGQVLDITAEQWKEMIDVNLTGAFNTAKASIPHILAQGRGGSVIFTASLSGIAAVRNIGHYNASKSGVIGLAKTLALELGEHHIRVNSICPTNVDSPMFQNLATMRIFAPGVERPGPAELEAAAREQHVIPIPSLDINDVTNAVMYLASDDGRYVTGTTFLIDGGRLLK
jgi:(+)-trans-carveol dehydrogenase